MKQIMIVCGYTFRDAAKKKAFIISTVIMLVIILILTLIPRLSLLFSNDDTGGVTGGVTDGGTAAAGETSKICYYIDDDKLITGAVQTLSSVFTDAAFIEADSDMIDTYRGEIEADPDIVMIEVTMMNELPFINVVTRDFMSGIPTEQMVELLSNVYISQTLALQGIDAETIAFARSTLPFAVETAGNMDFSGYVLGIVLTMLIFFAIYYYGYGVFMSIATEKTSRVMETLIVSAKPSRILL
ncbi:MAG: ABC transporter permease, partial [Eubacteriales bacterium]|nr:ABC transporter permease [Eubacteriales bacterium]